MQKAVFILFAPNIILGSFLYVWAEFWALFFNNNLILQYVLLKKLDFLKHFLVI